MFLSQIHKKDDWKTDESFETVGEAMVVVEVVERTGSPLLRESDTLLAEIVSGEPDLVHPERHPRWCTKGEGEETGQVPHADTTRLKTESTSHARASSIINASSNDVTRRVVTLVTVSFGGAALCQYWQLSPRTTYCNFTHSSSTPPKECERSASLLRRRVRSHPTCCPSTANSVPGHKSAQCRPVQIHQVNIRASGL